MLPFASFAIVLFVLPGSGGVTFSVDDYGARPDNKTINTEAFRAATQAAAKAASTGTEAIVV